MQDNPPGKDGLSVDSCERIIISLLLENVLAPNPVWSAYECVAVIHCFVAKISVVYVTSSHLVILASISISTVIYFVLGVKGRAILQSPNPNFIIRLPKQEPKKAAAKNPTKATKQSKARKAVADDGEWLSAKPKAKKRKKAATKAKRSKAAKKKSTKAKAKTTKKKAAKVPTKSAAKHSKAQLADSEVIDLLSDDEDDESADDVPLTSLKRDESKSAEEELWDDDESDEEYEFE